MFQDPRHTLLHPNPTHSCENPNSQNLQPLNLKYLSRTPNTPTRTLNPTLPKSRTWAPPAAQNFRSTRHRRRDPPMPATATQTPLTGLQGLGLCGLRVSEL